MIKSIIYAEVIKKNGACNFIINIDGKEHNSIVKINRHGTRKFMVKNTIRINDWVIIQKLDIPIKNTKYLIIEKLDEKQIKNLKLKSNTKEKMNLNPLDNQLFCFEDESDSDQENDDDFNIDSI